MIQDDTSIFRPRIDDDPLRAPFRMPVVKAEADRSRDAKKETAHRTPRVISKIWHSKAGVPTLQWSRLDKVGKRT